MELRDITKDIEELIRVLENTDVRRLDVQLGDVRVSIRRTGPPGEVRVPSHVGEESRPRTSAPQESDRYVYITSPMVGTFYRASSPDAKPFISVGDMVEPGRTVCIIEAMKIMNELASEVRGRIVEILVENGQPVEYGQKLFVVDPLIEERAEV